MKYKVGQFIQFATDEVYFISKMTEILQWGVPVKAFIAQNHIGERKFVYEHTNARILSKQEAAPYKLEML